ncbi:unnamed protein product [Rotaria sordida]|uniref:Thioredoxin domain-containing protein n=1 Tax=Rotaria sordida TaxID=392033 RepID=A0A815CBG4_9BILA|nr:unnamed protein product [Rotaria sordida]CAF1382542.1 unnamed protein product [Rotaria sordida]CAF1557477.1 unnamed protein product [Rotaria sordida]
MTQRYRIACDEPKELNTVEEAKAKIQDHKLAVILFNERYPEPNTVEHKFNWCRQVYEHKFDLHCYKCLDEDKFKTGFNIKVTPAFIFFRDGEEIDRFEDADQPESNAPKEEKDPKEYRIRTYLDKLCTKQN